MPRPGPSYASEGPMIRMSVSIPRKLKIRFDTEAALRQIQKQELLIEMIRVYLDKAEKARHVENNGSRT